MVAGRWRDLLSDPISITDDGQVINGQHRIAAVERAYEMREGESLPNDPAFLVIWGVDPSEAQLADTGSNRTARDAQTIGSKLLRGTGSGAVS